LTTNRTLDLTSSLEVGPVTNHASVDGSSCHLRSVLTIAFQFPFESNLQDNVATMARQYVRSVISSVQRVATAISPSGLNPALGPKLSAGSPEAQTLAHWICQSYWQVLPQVSSWFSDYINNSNSNEAIIIKLSHVLLLCVLEYNICSLICQSILLCSFYDILSLIELSDLSFFNQLPFRSRITEI